MRSSIFTALLLFIVIVPVTGQDTAVLSGTVTDLETGRPIPWVQVQTVNLDRHADADVNGRFEFTKIPAGSHRLRFFRIGYAEAEIIVTVSGGERREVAIALVLAPVMVETVVVERDRESNDTGIVLEGGRIDRQLGTTIAQTLMNEPGFAMQSMGPAPARPVLRGLSGERLLILQDGSKSGDLSAKSADHALVIEPIHATSIEVLRGPAALAYGPSTLGGVVNVVREAVPTLRPNRMQATFTSQAESVNRSMTSGIKLMAPVGALVASAEGSYRFAQDVRTPGGTLRNSHIRNIDLLGGAGMVQRNGHTGVAGSYYGSEYGIPGGFVGAHPDGVRVRLNRMQVEARSVQYPHISQISSLELHALATRYFHQEFESNGSVGVEVGMITAEAGLQLVTASVGPFDAGGIGLIVEQKHFVAGGLYTTPSSRERSIAGYLHQRLTVGRLQVAGGGRLDARSITPDREEHDHPHTEGIRRAFQGATGSILVSYESINGLRIGGTVMRSLRMPGPEELYSEGPHLAAYTFEIGNPDLGTEHGLGIDGFIRFESEPTTVGVTFFRNTINDYIFPQATGKLNSRTLLPEYRFTGINARMVGAEAAAEFLILSRLRVSGDASVVRGTLVPSDEPLPFMPPLSGRLVVAYEHGIGQLGVTVIARSRQDRVGTFETPTDGYTLFGAFGRLLLRYGRTLHTVALTLENATDITYRDHLSRVKEIIPQPGRNVRLLYRAYL